MKRLDKAKKMYAGLARWRRVVAAVSTATAVAGTGWLAGEPAAAASSVVHLTYWTAWSGSWATLIHNEVQEFNRTHSNIQVSVLSTPDNTYTKLLSAIAAGDPPNVFADITTLGPADLADKGGLQNLSGFVSGRYKQFLGWMYPVTKKLVTVDGKLYGVPMYFDVYNLYYNKDLMKQAGLNPNEPPKTLAQLQADQAKIWKVSGSRVSQIGYYPAAADLMYWTASFGVQLYKGGHWDFTGNKAFLAELSFIKSFSKYPYSATSGLISSMSPAGGSTDAFDAGKVGFYISGAWEIAQLKEDNPTMHWGVEPLPKGFPTGTTNGAFVDQNYNAIPKGAKNQAAAWEFMAWLAGFNNESYVAKAIQPFGQPSAPSVVGAPGYRTFLKSVPARNAFISVLSNPHDTFWPVSCVDAQLSTEETNVQQALLSTKMTAQGGASYLQKHMDAAKC